MDMHELVAKQQLEIENQKQRILALEGSLSMIHILMICVGGPLNDNFLKYSKEQSVIFHRMEDIIDDLNIK